MSYLKVLGLVGIVLEVVGAAYLVYQAHKSRRLLEGIDPKTFGGVGEMAEKTYEIIRGQAKTEFKGFSLLGFGLVLQFAGTLFSN